MNLLKIKHIHWFICLLIGFLFNSLEDVSAIPNQPFIQSDNNRTILFISGNSTAKNGADKGWGSTSSQTFRTQGFWQKVVDKLKAGDFVIMQFGHNDSSPINDKRRARGTIKGNGEKSVEIDNMLTGEHEIVHSYGWYIRRFIKETRAKGATPVVCSLIPRNCWTDDKLNRSVDSFALWAQQAAEQEGAFFIPFNKLISDHYDNIGQERVTALYFDKDETTHTNAMGAQMNATILSEAIKSTEGLDLKKFLKVVVPQ